MSTISSNVTIDIANDVMTAIKTWSAEKHLWYVNIGQGFASDYNADVFVKSIAVIRKDKAIIIGVSYNSGRHSNKFYRMLQSSFRKFCQNKIVKAIERKYGYAAVFQDLENHNPNPEIQSSKYLQSSIEELQKSKTTLSW